MTEARALQRPPAEVRFRDELAQLAQEDAGQPRPPGWKLSMPTVRRFVLGDPASGIQSKIVGPPSAIDRAMVSLATQRGLMLVGAPGTAKSLLAELLAAAISGRSTLTIQGGAATTEDQITYGWNYALLVAEGPSERSLVPAPVLTGMREGLIVRFEEITRCPLEVQDALLSVLSERALTVPELGEAHTVYAREGFNLIATANTRDRGVNETSDALRRRFNFETMFPIADFRAELALVERESSELLARSGVPEALPEDALAVIVETFRALREETAEAAWGEAPNAAAMSTAECVSVAHAVGVRARFARGGQAGPKELMSDFVEHLAGAAAQDDPEALRRLRRHLEQRTKRREGAWWEALHAAKHRLPEP
ncbi:MAG: MoxR family ATPase [Sandaracinaceae bacterium]